MDVIFIVVVHRRNSCAVHIICDGISFTTTALDEVNIGQVYNQYRSKYGIPFPDEIKHVRQRYGLSATKMSQILGFGDNQYRLYENGDMPSETNGKILMSIQNPLIFENFVINAKNQFDEQDYAKILEKVRAIKADKNELLIKNYIFNGIRRDIFNGYATQSINKLKNIILFFIEKFDGAFYTMMKLAITKKLGKRMLTVVK